MARGYWHPRDRAGIVCLVWSLFPFPLGLGMYTIVKGKKVHNKVRQS